MTTADLRDAAEPGLGELFAQLRRDVEELARAEIELVRVQTLDRLSHYKSAAIFFAVAGVLGFAGFIALLVGLILTLSPLVGPGGATAIVIGGVFVLAILLALLGRAQLTAKSAK